MTDPEALPISTFKLIPEYIKHYANIAPEREALVLGDQRILYRELSRRVDECAKGLMASGIRKGDRVATLSPPNPDFLILFLATSSIGAIWVGLNPRYRMEELKHVIADSQPRLLFTRTRLGERHYGEDLARLKSEHPSLEQVIVLGADPAVRGISTSHAEFIGRASEITTKQLRSACESVEPSDPALLVYTSGTTGRPKGAVIPHRGLAKCARVQLRCLGLASIRMLNYLPINHIGCVGDISCYVLAGGGTIVFMEKFGEKEAMELLQQEKITLWGGVPSTFHMCLALPNFSEYDLSSLQLIAWGGATASPALIEKLISICPRLSCSYGLTESVGSISFVQPCSDLDVLAHTVGALVPEYEVRIAGKDDQPVGAGETGEIQVRGDFIMLGYWNQPQSTAEAINKDGWLHTGDLGRIRPDGNLQLVGRLKEMFKSGSYNIYPREIEQALEEHPKVAMAAVIGVPDPLYQEVGRAYILPEPPGDLTCEELEQHCRQRLANYKIPKVFVIKEELPMLAIGKIDKQALKNIAA